ncbi:MAG: hypothetical protein PHW33_02210 [Candidatus Portnoybacteria bacterium]|jgi:hypothetical protein|nr:hypothetical protein [Candidatus Portnoybacteria bacterium]
MSRKWAVHHIITGVTEKMKKVLPKGLRCANDKIKVPEWPHPLNDKFYKWCLKFGIGSGFSL